MEVDKRWLIPGLLGSVLYVAYTTFSIPALDAEQQPNGELTAAQSKALEYRISKTVRERGTLESANSLSIRSMLDAPTTIFAVAEDGRKVKKGETILQFDDSNLVDERNKREILIAVARANVRRGEAIVKGRKVEQVAELKALHLAVQAAELAQSGFLAEDGAQQLELKIAASEITLTQQRVAAMTVQVKRLEKEANEITEILRARNELAKEKTALIVAEAKRKLLITHTHKQKSAVLAAAVARHKADLIRLTNSSQAALLLAEAGLHSYRSELQTELARLKRINAQISLCKVTAPRDGVVFRVTETSRRSEPIVTEVGATIRPRQMALQMPDLKRLQLHVRVHETRIRRVRVGQTVSLLIDALPGTKFLGKVQSVARVPVRGEWPNTDLMSFEVIVTVEKPTSDLRIGMNGMAEIDVGAKN
jgi:multidrug resistance efflux pump